MCKEENKVVNRDWVDHQACSVPQYIYVITIRLMIINYFNKLLWKEILVPTIIINLYTKSTL